MFTVVDATASSPASRWTAVASSSRKGRRTRRAVALIRGVKAQLRDRGERATDGPLASLEQALVKQLGAVEGEFYQVKLRSELDASIHPIKLNNRLTNLQMSIETGDGAPTVQAAASFEALSAELATLTSRLRAILNGPMAELNRALAARGLESVKVP